MNITNQNGIPSAFFTHFPAEGEDTRTSKRLSCKSTNSILVHPRQNVYRIFSSHMSNDIHITPLNKDLCQHEALIGIKKLLEEIKFNGIRSLIDYCKANNFNTLQIVFEWINYYISSDERGILENFKHDSTTVIGVNNFIETFSLEKEETLTLNGFKYYTSETRNEVIKLCIELINNTDAFSWYSNTNSNEFDCLMNKFLFHIFTLNFESALVVIKEVININDHKKVPQGLIPYLVIFQEVVLHFNSSSSSSFYTLNDTVKNIMSNFDKIDLPSNIQYMILFLHQKFHLKINEFLLNTNLSLMIKLIYIFKFFSKEEVAHYFEKLRNIKVKKGLLEGLILTGDSKYSISLLETYLNTTDNLLVTYLLSRFFVDSKELFYKKCEYELFETLNKLKMFNERIQLTQQLTEILSQLEKLHMNSVMTYRISTISDRKSDKISNSCLYFPSANSVESFLTCFFCNSKLHADKFDLRMNVTKDINEYIDFCPKCVRNFHSCAICLCPIEVNIVLNRPKVSPSSHSIDQKKEKQVETTEGHELKFIWCSKCRHGGHLDHVKEWFSELMICPVADCGCLCLEYNHIII